LTGWILKDGHKMSKSLGNVLTVEQILHYGKDMFTNFVFRSVNPGEDIDISWKSYFERYNSDLANGIGNLLSRTLAMIEKYYAGKIPKFHLEQITDEQLKHEKNIIEIQQKVAQYFDEFKIADALHEIWKIIAFADKHIADQKPWEIAKIRDNGSDNPTQSQLANAQLANVLATVVASLKSVGYLAYPFFPEKMLSLLKSIGENTDNISNFFNTVSHYYTINCEHVFTTSDIPKLYNRVDINAELASMNQESSKQPVAEKKLSESVTLASETSSIISIEDFTKIDLRVGTVTSAEVVEGSNKLLKLSVSLGELGTKQIFSGIREWVKPEEIANKKVVIVSNLAPRKMKFGLSQGMMLATDTIDGKVSPIYLSEELKEGSRLS
jgi:methionyl-tRNA synthetase